MAMSIAKNPAELAELASEFPCLTYVPYAMDIQDKPMVRKQVTKEMLDFLENLYSLLEMMYIVKNTYLRSMNRIPDRIIREIRQHKGKRTQRMKAFERTLPSTLAAKPFNIIAANSQLSATRRVSHSTSVLTGKSKAAMPKQAVSAISTNPAAPAKSNLKSSVKAKKGKDKTDTDQVCSITFSLAIWTIKISSFLSFTLQSF